MQILMLTLGGAQVAVSAEQIERVAEWPSSIDLPVSPLHQALGLPGDAEESARVLICRSPRAGFTVPATLLQREAPAGSLFTLPTLLRRLGPPSWLVGIALLDGSLSLFVDLQRLSR